MSRPAHSAAREAALGLLYFYGRMQGVRVNVMDIHKEIDTRGLHCPLPILRAKKALAELESGQVLKVLATDAGSLRDFEAFTRQTGHVLLEQHTLGAEYVHIIRKK